MDKFASKLQNLVQNSSKTGQKHVKNGPKLATFEKSEIFQIDQFFRAPIESMNLEKWVRCKQGHEKCVKVIKTGL